MSAETGVGPSIASGNQTYSGICALLPVAPTNSSRQIAESVPKPIVSTGIAAAWLVGHVGGRVHVNERADAGDDQNHHPGEWIEPEAPGHLKRADTGPGLQSDRRNPGSDVDVELARVGR